MDKPEWLLEIENNPFLPMHAGGDCKALLSALNKAYEALGLNNIWLGAALEILEHEGYRKNCEGIREMIAHNDKILSFNPLETQP